MTQKVGGSLALHWQAWRPYVSPGPILTILREGYVLPLKSRVPLTDVPRAFRQGDPAILDPLVEDLVTKQAIEEVPLPRGPGFYSHVFAVEKSSGGHRLVINLRELNRHLNVPSFRMETNRSVLAALHASRWAVSLDLKDAYNHVLVHPKARPYLRFTHGQTVWQFRALPFGLSTAPFTFTWLMRPVLKEMRRRGIHVNAYLDDWILHHPSREVLQSQVPFTLDLLNSLGLQVNWAKSHLTPTQHLEYLGMEIDLERQLVLPTRAKCLSIQHDILGALPPAPPQPAKFWRRLLGQIGYISNFVPLGRLHTRPLTSFFQWDRNWHKAKKRPVNLRAEVLPHLQWWTDLPTLRQGITLAPPPPSMTLFTDASTSGWGAHLMGKMAQGSWTAQEQREHINILEMRAIANAVEAFQDILAQQTIVIASDNTTVLAYLRKQGGTKSQSLTNLSWHLLYRLEELGTAIRMRHIPGKRNVLADLLSRRDQVVHTEWTLSQEAFAWLYHQVPHPTLDAFANCLNHQLDRYWSPVQDPQAVAVDAMTQDWSQEQLYMFPPTPLIPAVLRKLSTQPHHAVTLLVPWREGAPWFPHLLRLLQQEHARTISFPALPGLLSQPLTGQEMHDVTGFALTACVLSEKH